MTQKEHLSTGSEADFICWHDVDKKELDEIRQTLKAHPQFHRLHRLETSTQTLPASSETYIDDKENYISFLYPGHSQNDIKVISSPGSSPIVEDILGFKHSEKLDF